MTLLQLMKSSFHSKDHVQMLLQLWEYFSWASVEHFWNEQPWLPTVTIIEQVDIVLLAPIYSCTILLAFCCRNLVPLTTDFRSFVCFAILLLWASLNFATAQAKVVILLFTGWFILIFLWRTLIDSHLKLYPNRSSLTLNLFMIVLSTFCCFANFSNNLI